MIVVKNSMNKPEAQQIQISTNTFPCKFEIENLLFWIIFVHLVGIECNKL